MYTGYEVRMGKHAMEIYSSKGEYALTWDEAVAKLLDIKCLRDQLKSPAVSNLEILSHH